VVARPTRCPYSPHHPTKNCVLSLDSALLDALVSFFPHLTHCLTSHVFLSPTRTSHHFIPAFLDLNHTSAFYHFQYCDIPSDVALFFLSLPFSLFMKEPNASPGAPLHFFHSVYSVHAFAVDMLKIKFICSSSQYRPIVVFEPFHQDRFV